MFTYCIQMKTLVTTITSHVIMYQLICCLHSQEDRSYLVCKSSVRFMRTCLVFFCSAGYRKLFYRVAILLCPIVKVFFLHTKVDNLEKMKDTDTCEHTLKQISDLLFEAVIPRCSTDREGCSLLQRLLLGWLSCESFLSVASFVKQEEKTVPRSLLLATETALMTKILIQWRIKALVFIF